MSDTPRTDREDSWVIVPGMSFKSSYVPTEFARQLERDLAAANEQIVALRAEVEQERAAADSMSQSCATALNRAEAAEARAAERGETLRQIQQALAAAEGDDLVAVVVAVVARVTSLEAERAAALNHLDDYGRTNPDLPSACFAAVESANHWRLEAEGLRRDCERLGRAVLEMHDSLMTVRPYSQPPSMMFREECLFVARKHAEKGGAS